MATAVDAMQDGDEVQGEDSFSPMTVEQDDPGEDARRAEGGEPTIKTPVGVRFREKVFKSRPSLLTTIFGETHGLVYNFFASLFLLYALAIISGDFIEHENPFHHVWLIGWNFQQLPITMLAWSAMLASTMLGPYLGMRLWSNIGVKRITTLTQLPFVSAYVCYLVSLFYHSLRFLYAWRLEPACSFIIVCENTRLAMKSHAFVRENYERAKRRKLALGNKARGGMCEEKSVPLTGFPPHGSAHDAESWPSVVQFVYFMFCPSLLYRDSYPRTESRSWLRAANHGIHALASIYVTNLIFASCIQPTFSALDYHTFTWWRLLHLVFISSFWGGVSLLMLFYGLLHCWMNMWSECLRFGDRLFYANWWSSTNMAEYYRNWNLVVHEWLYAYVYRDVSLLVGRRWGLQVAQTLVFFLSAACHEYWFGIALRQFYPIMFTLYFVFGGVFFFLSRIVRITPSVWNIAMWCNLLFGTGLFVCCYAPEWYARQRCARVFKSHWADVLVPRIWLC